MTIREDANKLCKLLYHELSLIGFYPALTGGVLYKKGVRKDIDIIVYRNRQLVEDFELKDIESTLEKVGMIEFKHYGFVTKCLWMGYSVDLLNPETSDSKGYDNPIKFKITGRFNDETVLEIKKGSRGAMTDLLRVIVENELHNGG
jgi:hypothetical protein